MAETEASLRATIKALAETVDSQKAEIERLQDDLQRWAAEAAEGEW